MPDALQLERELKILQCVNFSIQYRTAGYAHWLHQLLTSAAGLVLIRHVHTILSVCATWSCDTVPLKA